MLNKSPLFVFFAKRIQKNQQSQKLLRKPKYYKIIFPISQKSNCLDSSKK